MNPQVSRARYAVGGITLAVMMFFSVNILINDVAQSWKWDLTEDNIFTLSDSTRSVLGDLDEPVTVRLFYSRRLGERAPTLALYHDRVQAILEQYSDLSSGKFILEYYDPEPFSETEDRAVAFGLQGIPISEAGDLAYFGLAASNSTDDSEIIPFLSQDRAEFLEYDLTRMVFNLANPDKPVLGILSTVPLLGTPQGGRPLAVMDQVLELFEIRYLAKDGTDIPEDVDVLLIVHPHGTSDSMLYAIDQFVLAGGRAMVFVDPHAEIDQINSQQQGVPPGISDFNRQLNAWGVTLVEDVIAGDIDNARGVSYPQNGQMVGVDYVAWLSLVAQNFDAGDTVMSELDAINMATSGVLDVQEGATASVKPLITTGSRSMRMATDDFSQLPDVIKMFREFEPSGVREVLAARISGEVKTAYPNGAPDSASLDGPHLSVSSQPTNLIVVADVDILLDRFWVERRDLLGQQVSIPLANNGDFLLNALENLTGSPALISLRGRGTTSRPFYMVEKIKLEAERQYRVKEQELRTNLKDAESRFSDLVTRANAGDDVIITDEDQQVIGEVRSQILSIRSDLRTVQHELRRDIDELERLLKFLNIGAVPLIMGIGIVLMALFRRRTKQAARLVTEV